MSRLCIAFSFAALLPFAPKDFKISEGEALATWESVDLLLFRAYYEKGENLLGSKTWAGGQPAFRRVRWEGKGR